MDTILLVPVDQSSLSDDMLANTFEAFLGALFLDQGLEAASQFCAKFLIKTQSQIPVLGKLKIEKSQLGTKKNWREN